MTAFLQYWGSTIFTGIVLLGLGTVIVVQDLRHSTLQLKLYEELIDAYDFNGHLNTDNAVKGLQLEQLEEVLELQHNLLRDMHEELNNLKGIPPFPEKNKKDRPNRSEA